MQSWYRNSKTWINDGVGSQVKSNHYLNYLHIWPFTVNNRSNLLPTETTPSITQVAVPSTTIAKSNQFKSKQFVWLWFSMSTTTTKSMANNNCWMWLISKWSLSNMWKNRTYCIDMVVVVKVLEAARRHITSPCSALLWIILFQIRTWLQTQGSQIT